MWHYLFLKHEPTSSTKVTQKAHYGSALESVENHMLPETMGWIKHISISDESLTARSLLFQFCPSENFAFVSSKEVSSVTQSPNIC